MSGLPRPEPDLLPPPDSLLTVAQARRWYWQRISAMVLALCVLVHLGVMIYAVRGGLSAAEILGRTRGNPAVAPDQIE